MIALASGRDWLSLFGTPQIHHRLCSCPRPWGSPCPQEPLNQTQSDLFVHRKHGGATTDLLEEVRVGLNGCHTNTGAAQQRCDSLNKPLEATCEQVDVKGTKFYSHCFFSWVLCFQWSAWKYSWALQASAWEFSFWGQPLQVLRENCPLPATELWKKQLQGWVFVNYSFSLSE